MAQFSELTFYFSTKTTTKRDAKCSANLVAFLRVISGFAI
jgi:hypothetical protein